MKVLISYFSASGVTRRVAEKIKEVTGGSLFEIEPVNPYTKEDLNWMNSQSRSSVEMKDKSSRPSIKNKVENIEEYDTILIGYPIWWYTAPTIIQTFIEKNSLENKKIYLFATSGGSGVEKSLEDLKKTYPNLNFVSCKRFSNVTEEEIKQWLF